MLGNFNRNNARHIVSKATGVEPEAYFHVRQSVAAVKSIWKAVAETNKTRIETVIDNHIPEFLPINSLRIQHCLNNLVGNAVKITQNGAVRIVATKLKTSNSKTYIALSVQDTGSGLTAEEISTIFERRHNYSASQQPEYGVIDTGLPMTQDLISELGGKILVQSKLGQGSTFTLLLPFEATSLCKEFEAIKENAYKNSPFSNLNILVVDDYNLNQLTIKTLLHGHRGKIFSASQGYEALEIIQSCPVDLVLMDIHMSILDGVQTTIKIRESTQKWADIQIFAMTADPQYHHSRLYQKIGMDGSLAKPFRKDDILRVLKQSAEQTNRVAAE